MDGRDFLKALRSHKMLCHVPVVVISGVEDAEVIHATDNVRKSALLEGLRRVLERLQAARGACPRRGCPTRIHARFGVKCFHGQTGLPALFAREGP